MKRTKPAKTTQADVKRFAHQVWKYLDEAKFKIERMYVLRLEQTNPDYSDANDAVAAAHLSIAKTINYIQKKQKEWGMND